MTYKVSCTIAIILLFSSIVSVAQKQLSAEEVDFFYGLIKQTKEYKTVKHQVDSVNNAMSKDQMPQEISMNILKKESAAAADDFIFYANLERKLAIGMLVDLYIFEYDKRKRQIVSTKHEKTRYQLE